MLTIRLTRKGKKNQPFFRVVVIDKRRSAKGGRAVEILGFVNPLTKKKSLKKERILYWIKNGAKPSATMHNLLVREKIISGKKINVSKNKNSNKNMSSGLGAEKPVAEVFSTAQQETPVEPLKNETKESSSPSVPQTDKTIQ